MHKRILLCIFLTSKRELEGIIVSIRQLEKQLRSLDLREEKPKNVKHIKM